MAALTDIYIDVFSQTIVSGLSGLAVTALNFYQGDTPTLRIWLLIPTFNPMAPYTQMPISGLTLEVAIGQKKGTGGIVYTSQLTWAPSTDPNNPNYFLGTLPINTAAMNTAIGSGSGTTDAYFQVVYIQGGVQTTVLELSCNVNASVIQGAGVVVPPNLTPVSFEYAEATYLKRTIIGAVTLTNPNTGKSVLFCLGDDNQIHFDPIN